MRLKENVLRYYGQNYPIGYEPHYHFEEQWEDKKKSKEKNTYYNYLNLRNKFSMGF